MALPFFYEEHLKSEPYFSLSEDTSRHVTQVLRMKAGELLTLTDGKGKLVKVCLELENKKASTVKTISESFQELQKNPVTIAISLVKNAHRFEWFIEKATEIGVSHIVPLLCERTERQQFRLSRIRGIMISAMLQSQQAWLPGLVEPIQFKKFIPQPFSGGMFIAHCLEEEKNELQPLTSIQDHGSTIMIGPEGDFTKAEIDQALARNFVPVTLGHTRLRTETAGIVACVLLAGT